MGQAYIVSTPGGTSDRSQALVASCSKTLRFVHQDKFSLQATALH